MLPQDQGSLPRRLPLAADQWMLLLLLLLLLLL
jgi:hypothetical protein